MKKIDINSSKNTTIIVGIFGIIIYLLVNIHTKITVSFIYIIALIFAIIFIPIIFVKKMRDINKYAPEKNLFIEARRLKIPLAQEWNEKGFFKFQKAEKDDVVNSYSKKGLQIVQKIKMNENTNLYKEAFQTISSKYISNDIISFKQMIDAIAQKKENKNLETILIVGVAIFIVLIGLGAFLKMKG